ncbi:hypothetical protein D4740_04735 [Actinomyces sp. 2119]|uniref:Uncharacterized protein n=1 Tax=Actinomyces lilanjuaniae TaxID=2321394 RepID=A0ABM6Z3B0_9ACTO|nr:MULTISPECIES: hypothetical protein [Actinomyces]AYD89469.1 hypothetical protein D5R93_04270 [Actinomyces lilanjuaniae]RJF43173.1 hypothetical protein D4740_04735 [Actinomyces sp. 2119]
MSSIVRLLARRLLMRGHDPGPCGPERGDVPGWVLVTLMTAGLVVALWAVAGPTLTQVFVDAIGRVTGAV